MPIIGNINLARDIKTALQAVDTEVDEEVVKGGKQRLEDAKGRETLNPEETAKKEERDKIKADKDREKVTLSARAAAFCTRSSMLEITTRVPKKKKTRK